jgi:hypothetical protein
MAWYSRSVRVWAGADGDGVAGVDAHGIEVLDGADDHEVVGPVPHHLQLVFLPAGDRFLDQDLVHGREVQPAGDRLLELLRVVGDPPARPAQREGRPDHGGQPRLLEDGPGLLHRAREAALGQVQADALHGRLEEPAVLPHLDGAATGPDEADAETVEHAAAGQLHREVQRGLAPDGGQHRVGPLPLQHGFQHLGRQRLDVRPVRVLRVGHDGRGVGVHQRHADAFLLQDLDGLGAGVVELAGLPDHDGPRADDEDGLEARVPGQFRDAPAVPT